MIIPLFCQGKAVERETSQAVGIGAKVIPTPDAASYFESGNRIFISEPDATEIEYLGSVQSVAADSITATLATEAAKGSGAKLWTPAALFEWPVGSESAARRVRHTGVETVRSLGGNAWATRLESPYEIEVVRFDNLTREKSEQLSAWFDNEAGGGLEEFTYVDAARAVWRVRLDAPTLEWSPTARGLIAGEFKLHLLGEAAYV